jgi:two-component system, sensor histidine kinase and response regulator
MRAFFKPAFFKPAFFKPAFFKPALFQPALFQPALAMMMSEMSSQSAPIAPLILVVDDDLDNYQVIEIMLSQDPYALVHVETGLAALAFLEQQTPDLIFMDVMMPKMDGLETCRRIKAQPHLAAVPVMAVTALDSKADLANCIAAGADDFISKPLNRIELRARTRSLLRIKEQYDRLQTLLRLREDLSYMIVHDLRGPMTSLAMSAGILERLQPDPLVQRQVQRISSSVQRLQCMIDSLLMLAKLQAEKLEPHCQTTDLLALIQDALADVQLIANQRSITIQSQLPTDRLLRDLDPILIRRVVDNLLSNALKYSPSGSQILLKLQTLPTPPLPSSLSHPQPPPQSALGSAPQHDPQNNPQHDPQNNPRLPVQIQILDSGTGVSEELQDRLFQRFETGDISPNAEAQNVQGIAQTGLGLAFCKMAVEAHGGSITVASNYPKGSVFTVTL